MAAISSDPFIGSISRIQIVNIADDPAEQTHETVQTFTGMDGNISRVAWTDLNRTLVSAGEDGKVRRWDVEVMEPITAAAPAQSFLVFGGKGSAASRTALCL
jgi:WD40 repeat protein